MLSARCLFAPCLLASLLALPACASDDEAAASADASVGEPDAGDAAEAAPPVDHCPLDADASTAKVPWTAPGAAARVDPLVGTSGSGNTVPGALVPHGMVKLSPDTDVEVGSIKAYSYDDTKLQGFSHTHLEGPGGSNMGYSEVLLLPQTGTLETSPYKNPTRFSHATEVVTPGYYAVTLDDEDVRVELTATAHAGVHRYTFPACGGNRVLVDAGHTRGRSVGGEVHVVGDDTVEGFGDYQVEPVIAFALNGVAPKTGLATAFFSVKFDRPFASAGTWQSSDVVPGRRDVTGDHAGAWVELDAMAGRVVEARVGVSFIDVAQARKNRDDELGAATFEQIRDRAGAAWDTHLSRIEVEGGTDAQRSMLSTALYHALLQPADYTEGDRFFLGGGDAGAVQPAAGHHFYADDWCAWDTARGTFPMLGLLDPEVVPDMIQSYVTWYEHAGWMSKCSWHALGDSRVMTGNFNFCSIADAWAKGLRGFDVAKAYEGMRKGSMEDSRNPGEDGLCGYFGQGTPPDYVNLGWVPEECDTLQAASMTLEHAQADGCVAQIASAVGNDADAALFTARSGNWKNTWNPAHRFPQLRARDGHFLEPFDPTSGNGFTEADAWKYRWSVPQDLCGLVTAIGGAQAFEAELDAFFDGGHFDVSNEPDFHAPWLYDLVGAPAKTASRLRQVVAASFSTAPGGLPGNDDAGATSSWLAFALMGLYPVTPGSGLYWLGSPHFDRVTFHIDPAGGKDFVLEAQGNGPDAPYVQSATLDGVPLTDPRLRDADLRKGGKLVLVMGPTPSAWATTPVCP